MNKKGFIFSFLLFMSCFFVIGNIKAATSDFYDMSKWIDIDEFTLPNGINPDDYNIIIWERGNNGNSNSYRMVYSLKSDNYKIWLSTYPQYLPPSSFPYLTSSPGFSKNRIGGYDSIYYYDETILGSKIFNKKQSSGGSFSSSSYIVYSNYDIFYVNGEKLFDTSKINYDSGPKIYNTNNIDYIEYKFDNLPLQETELHIDYTFKSVTSDGQDDTIDFSAPFARDTYTGCDDLGGNCTTDEKYKDLLMYPIGTTGHIFQGSGNHILNSSPEHITNSFSIIIPFEYSLGSYVALDFDANLDYEMIIHYKDDENSVNSYIDTVDITGKYGAIFLPKYDDSNYVDSDSYYLTNFRIVGNVDVQVTDSRDMNNYNIQQIYSMNYCNTVYSNQTEIPYNCDNQSGIFSFRIDNLRANQTLRFVNHSYTEMSDRRTLIEYDTRYFNYGILDEPTSVVQVEDPTTHVVETVGLSDFYNQLNEENIGKSKITFKSAFNRFVSPIKFIFRTITNLYNNYLSSSVQHYFFLVFCLMILLLLIRVIF